MELILICHIACRWCLSGPNPFVPACGRGGGKGVLTIRVIQFIMPALNRSQLTCVTPSLPPSLDRPANVMHSKMERIEPQLPTICL